MHESDGLHERPPLMMTASNIQTACKCLSDKETPMGGQTVPELGGPRRGGVARLVAEGVLLRSLHHACALPPQLRHYRPQLGRTDSAGVVAHAQPRQSDVHAAERARAAYACARFQPELL
jgi:hypothetical protein